MEYIKFSPEALAELELCEVLSKYKKERAELLISCISKEITKFKELRNQLLTINTDESTKSELIELVDKNIDTLLKSIEEIKKKAEGTH